MRTSESAKRMAELIHHAIKDHEVTEAEYNEIMRIADEDGHLDSEEQSLLRELHSMIADKTVKRVKE